MTMSPKAGAGENLDIPRKGYYNGSKKSIKRKEVANMGNKGKRLLLIILSILVAGSLAARPAFAAEGSMALSASAASGRPGDRVLMTVSLSGFDPATSVSLNIRSDLILDASGSSWLLSGAPIGSSYSAWTGSAEVDVNGPIATLAFVLPEPAAGQSSFTYSVSCTAAVSGAEGEQGSASAYASVQLVHPATALSISSSALELDLAVNSSARLTASVTPANSSDLVSWSSGDAAVASVSDGTVTGHKPGSAVITATAGGFSRSCTVTVTCSHVLTVHEAVEPTCQRAGNQPYFSCNACGAVLDANRSATTLEAVTLERLPHTGGQATCTEYALCAQCGQPYGDLLPHASGKAYEKDPYNHWHRCKDCNAVTEKTAHTLTWVTDKAATEDATGLKHQECVCGYITGKDTVIEKLPHTHVGIRGTEAVPATCIKEGTAAYWTCSSDKCAGKYYEDAECKTLLKNIVLPVDPENHSGKKEVRDAVEATCGEKGYSGDAYCTDCKKCMEKGEEIPATEKHTAETEYQADQNRHWHLCRDCEAVMDKTKEDHIYLWIVDERPTESEEGRKHQECMICEHEAKKDTKIDKLEHIPKLVAGKEPTCTEEGVMEHFYCVNCTLYFASENGEPGSQVSKAGTVLPAAGHSFDSPWLSDGKGHWRTCSCGEIEKKQNHDFVLVGAVEATATKPGYTGDEICFTCQYPGAAGQEVPPIGQAETEAPQNPVRGQPSSSGRSTALLIWMGILMAAIVAVAFMLRKMNAEEK